MVAEIFGKIGQNNKDTHTHMHPHTHAPTKQSYMSSKIYPWFLAGSNYSKMWAKLPTLNYLKPSTVRNWKIIRKYFPNSEAAYFKIVHSVNSPRPTCLSVAKIWEKILAVKALPVSHGVRVAYSGWVELFKISVQILTNMFEK